MEDQRNCPFCADRLNERIVEKRGTAIAIEDRYPVTRHHMLVMPRRHTPDFFTMTSQERRDAEDLIVLMKNRILEKDPSVTGFNVGVNCGGSAGQTVMHAHIHLIPRRKGDTPLPRGGVRGVIPEKMAY
ncbi:MAG: HIT family protein [Desulfatiglans sp.]|jgi:diadenosine tetraphosphate (Ap4A) HIT family hydrolase|nr:HIT family protein [Thermodesulfobacteriota bacterium]MEE4352202.1 HIT family protein [Desulfatiglans sp.]